MSKVYCVSCILCLLTAIPVSAFAKLANTGDCMSCHALSPKDATELIKKTGVTVTSVKNAPIKGLYELQVEKVGQKGLLYMDFGKKHLIQGMAFSREKLTPATAHNLDSLQPKQPTTIDVKTIPLNGSIVMGNSNAIKKVYVFTDPDCPYCRKAHEELKKLTRIYPDVAIHIVLYPLPMHPGAYDKARIIFETRSLSVLDSAFEGKEVPKPTQESSKKIIDENIRFANANGISGTPTLVMPDGKIEVGMRDAETLKEMLEAKQGAK